MTTSENPFILKLNRSIDEHLDDPDFSIDTLCLTLGVSRSQLHRLLKEQSGRSASRYIRQRRLQKARQLLTTTDLRISEISDAVGIPNPQNFSTYFTEEFEVNPTDFRKTNGSASVFEGINPAPAQGDVPTSVGSSEWQRPSGRLVLPRKWIFAALVVVFSAVLVVILLPQFRGSAPAATNSLAILPFANLGDADGSPACQSIMNDIYTSVALINNLKVIARTSSDQYEGTPKSIFQIGDELGVANVLKGDFLKVGDTIQLKIEIVGTPNAVSSKKAEAWHKTYTASHQDIFKLTDEVVADVAQRLNLTSRTASTQDRLLAHTQNLEAYNAFLQGRQLLLSRKTADLLESLDRTNHALALDSTFAEALAIKAVAYHLLLGSGKISNDTLNRLTEENALRAIQLDPTSSTAYGVLGSLYYSTYQWQASENAFRIALQHNPNDAQVNHWYALLLRTTGRAKDAVYYSTQAMTLDPLHPIFLSAYISNCAFANRFDLARAGISAGRGLFDHSFAYQMNIAYYWLCKADYGRAVAYFRRALVLNPEDRGQIPILMYCEAKRGNRQQARRFLNELTATTPRSDYERAVVYAGLEQADSSMYHLRKAADGGYFYRDTKAMPVFQPYHKTLAFRAVMRRFNLAD